MCLLSVYSPYSSVNTEHLEAGACQNPDGYGFAIIVGDRIEFGHGMDAAATIHAFAAVRERHPESWALFHSRFTTDGIDSIDNCHPFIVGSDERTMLAHNGILPRSARPKGNDPRSDTRILAESLIPNGHFGKLHRPKGRRALEAWIASEGYPNKVAILTVDPRYKGNAFILGEGHGEWVNGVWHSNSDYIPWVPRRSSSLTASREWGSDAYASYMAGEISYSDYLDTKYGIAALPGSVVGESCQRCWRVEPVDQVYLYCTACKVCLDCDEPIASCACWIPKSERISEPADAISPVAIDSALADLPADQAGRIRAVLAEPQ